MVCLPCLSSSKTEIHSPRPAWPPQTDDNTTTQKKSPPLTFLLFFSPTSFKTPQLDQGVPRGSFYSVRFCFALFRLEVDRAPTASDEQHRQRPLPPPRRVPISRPPPLRTALEAAAYPLPQDALFRTELHFHPRNLYLATYPVHTYKRDSAAVAVFDTMVCTSVTTLSMRPPASWTWYTTRPTPPLTGFSPLGAF